MQNLVSFPKIKNILKSVWQFLNELHLIRNEFLKTLDMDI